MGTEVQAASPEHRDSPPTAPHSGRPSQWGRNEGVATRLVPSFCSWLGHAAISQWASQSRERFAPRWPKPGASVLDDWSTSLHNLLSQDRLLHSLDFRLKRSCQLCVAPLCSKGGSGWWLFPRSNCVQHHQGGKCPVGRGKPQIWRPHQELWKDVDSCLKHQETKVVLQVLGESFEAEWFSGRQSIIPISRLN